MIEPSDEWNSASSAMQFSLRHARGNRTRKPLQCITLRYTYTSRTRGSTRVQIMDSVFQCHTCKAIRPKAVGNSRDPTMYSECSRLRIRVPYDTSSSSAFSCRMSICRSLPHTTRHHRSCLRLVRASQLLTFGCLSLGLALAGRLVLLSSSIHLLANGVLAGHLSLSSVNLHMGESLVSIICSLSFSFPHLLSAFSCSPKYYYKRNVTYVLDEGALVLESITLAGVV